MRYLVIGRECGGSCQLQLPRTGGHLWQYRGCKYGLRKSQRDWCQTIASVGCKWCFSFALYGTARQELAAAIEQTEFKEPICPVYQNVDALPHTAPEEIKVNLLKQLTALMCWTQEVKHVIAYGAEEFIECGPGAVLTGLISKIQKSLEA